MSETLSHPNSLPPCLCPSDFLGNFQHASHWEWSVSGPGLKAEWFSALLPTYILTPSLCPKHLPEAGSNESWRMSTHFTDYHEIPRQWHPHFAPWHALGAHILLKWEAMDKQPVSKKTEPGPLLLPLTWFLPTTFLLSPGKTCWETGPNALSKNYVLM